MFLKMVYPFHESGTLYVLQLQSNIENIVENGAIAENEQFPLFTQCFQTRFKFILFIFKRFNTDILYAFPLPDTF